MVCSRQWAERTDQASNGSRGRQGPAGQTSHSDDTVKESIEEPCLPLIQVLCPVSTQKDDEIFQKASVLDSHQHFDGGG
jgi:ribosomal protein L15